MKSRKERTLFNPCCGFTLVELILVVLILSIAALFAVPMFSSAADIQVRSVANGIAADLDYTRGLAITRQKNYAVVFYPAAVSGHAAESYEIRDTATNTVVTNPLDGKPFAVNLTADSRVSGVDIFSANFDADASNAITFDHLGTPYKGNIASPTATVRLINQGVVTLKSRDKSFVLTVKVEPVTGCVTIQ
jgi:prepilin-type N-terminal cleavage/methylation domain-containing protein